MDYRPERTKESRTAARQKMAGRVGAVALALVVATAPLTVEWAAGAGFFVGASVAAAKDGDDNSGSGGGNSGSGSGGDDNSGHGSGGDDDSGRGSSNSGRGGGDDDGGGWRDDDRRGDDRDSRRGAHGERIQIDGGRIRVIYPDGFREEIRDGVFELKDPDGRTVVRRRATDKDVARLRALGT